MQTKITLASSSRFLWALVLVTLPVTSFRFMPFMGPGTYVRPLALYPLVLLFPVLLVRLYRGEIPKPWPGALTIILAFVLLALASTAFGFTLSPIELRNVAYLDRALRAGITLLIGLLFFMAAVWMNQGEADLKFSIRWLLVGLVADLAWGAIQFIGLNRGFRHILLQVQNLFSVRGLVKNKRISGFSFEPSWLAGQISSLYLPWLVAALLTRYRAISQETPARSTSHWVSMARLKSFIEPVLLLAATLELLMTYSRSGLAIAFLAAVFTFLLAGRGVLKSFWGWLRAGFDRRTDLYSSVRAAASRLLLGLVFLAAVAGVILFLSNKGYIAAFFKADKTNIFSYAQDVYLGPRLAYASAAMTAFDAHPFTGVGLGAAGFWIYQNMPDWVLSGNPEIAEQMSPISSLYPNAKNIYVRLLVETGLLGFVAFLAFYLALFADALGLLRGNHVAQWLAAAGIFSLAAIFLQGISQDSFAMPEMWINLGILAGAAGVLKTYNPGNQGNLS